MAFPITSLYASILAIAAIILSVLVSSQRGKTGVAIMDGGNPGLAVWIRRHGNFIENVPLALLLIGLAEARQMPALWLHLLGVVLIVTRLVHLIGLNAEQPANPTRVAGSVGTHLVMLAAVIFLLLSLR